VPDIRGQTPKDVEKQLRERGLQVGEKKDRCEQLGASDGNERDAKRGQIICQSPAPNSHVSPGTRVDYVLAGKGND
jgi:beta-lactam-binding protein with PASTA domain